MQCNAQEGLRLLWRCSLHLGYTSFSVGLDCREQHMWHSVRLPTDSLGQYRSLACILHLGHQCSDILGSVCINHRQHRSQYHKPRIFRACSELRKQSSHPNRPRMSFVEIPQDISMSRSPHIFRSSSGFTYQCIAGGRWCSLSLWNLQRYSPDSINIYRQY